jgi:plastocyanin
MRVIRSSLLALPAVIALLGACSGGPVPGWTYAPSPSSAAPSGSAAASGSAGPSGSAAPSASAEPSAAPSGSAPASAAASPAGSGSASGLSLVALNITFDKLELSTAAGQPFTIAFDNQDAGVPHDVDIRASDGTVLKEQEIITGPAQATYEYEPLEAGEYVFICSVHPVPGMTGRLVVQ